MLGTLSAKIIAIQFVVLLAVAGGSYLIIKSQGSTINTLRDDKAKLEVAVATQQATIAAQQEAAQRQNDESLRLQQNLADAETQRRSLESRIRRLNIEMAARTNRGEIEVQLNRQLADMLKDLERVTRPRDRQAVQSDPSRPTAPDIPAPASVTQPPSGGQTNPQPPPRPPVSDVQWRRQ